MSSQPQDEKELRKHEEKSVHEKKDEKSHDEKSRDEKNRRDPLSAVIWAAILIWAGLILLAGNLGILGQLANPESNGTASFLVNANSWALIFIGAGIIVLIEAALRIAMPVYRRPVMGTLVLSAILIGIGLGQIVGWSVIWPLVLIVLGAAILIGSVLRRA